VCLLKIFFIQKPSGLSGAGGCTHAQKKRRNKKFFWGGGGVKAADA